MAGYSIAYSKDNQITTHLYLNQYGEDGLIQENGARGTFGYKSKSGAFTFTGHNLEADRSYNLIWFFNPWPDGNFVCLGESITNNSGNINIIGTNIGLTDTSTPDLSIWLAPSTDIICDVQLVDWNPNYHIMTTPNTDPLFEVDTYKFDLTKLLKKPIHAANIERSLPPTWYEQLRWFLNCDLCPYLDPNLEQAAEQLIEKAKNGVQCAQCEFKEAIKLMNMTTCWKSCNIGPCGLGGGGPDCVQCIEACGVVDPTACDAVCQ